MVNTVPVLTALDKHNIRKVLQYIKKGFDLNKEIHHPKWEYNYVWLKRERTILIHAILKGKLNRLITLLALKKYVDLEVKEDGETALEKAICLGKTRMAHLLLLAGAKITPRVFQFRSLIGDQLVDEKTNEMTLILLSVGAKPVGCYRLASKQVREVVQNWVQGLKYSQARFRKIFDNSTLEKEICAFVFNEKYLEMII